jgi:hypothetical protein
MESPQHLRKGEGGVGILPGGLNRHPEIIPAAGGPKQEGKRLSSA